jgi:hypothetical protein
VCFGPVGQGFEYRQRRKDFSGELGQYSLYNYAVGRKGRGSNPGMRIFSESTKPPIQWVPVFFLGDNGAGAS